MKNQETMTCAEAAHRFGSELAKELSRYAEQGMITIGFIDWHS